MLHYGRLMRGFLLITSRVMTPEKTDGVLGVKQMVCWGRIDDAFGYNG